MAQETTMPPSQAQATARASLDSGPILLHWQGDVAVVTLNRPDKLNSFTRDMHRALVTALDHVETGGARALLLTGSGRGFCAGQDLADLDFTPGHATDLGELINAWFNPLVRRLQALPLPVIAAVNGTAAG
ncbi:MAG TPA: 2-(1,2-epoxy-1,2-dihydrophenyl)acetyl-CoA isomerase, partial [Cupriavidus sp.]|nr:2-(1,2-epoxy-1,2-dihydrophenyl)acetyl-CoA isomerase [Cupriavidus sp.]